MINGLQQKIDELTPPPEIETSEDVILKVNQLSIAINNMTNTINSLIPSIGEIYITISNENPSLKFGGTWEQIKDTFLLASGDVYSAGSIGGEAVHTLTIEEMPTHAHTYKRHTLNREDTSPETGEDAYGVSNKTLDTREGTTGSSGGYHAYYTNSSNSFEVNSLLSSGQESREYTYPTNTSSVTMVINKDGFHVDGELVTSNSRIGELNKIQIGSAEGNTRSNATYEYIKVVKYNS